VWAASSTGSFKIRDMVFDDNGYLWVVGRDSDQIHRFDATTRAETKFPFEGILSAVAYYSNDNELYVGGEIDSTQSIWKFTIDGSGNIGAGELYFDFGKHYDGIVASMILASNGELLVATGPEINNVSKPSIVKVFPDGRHEQLHNEMITDGAYSITWRDDKFAVVAIRGEETSINFLDMYDRTRSGIFGF
jgi:WD40 repeat protein